MTIFITFEAFTGISQSILTILRQGAHTSINFPMLSLDQPVPKKDSTDHHIKTQPCLLWGFAGIVKLEIIYTLSGCFCLHGLKR